jgi:hypothetical protein
MIPQASPLYLTYRGNDHVSVVVGWDADTRRPYVVPTGTGRTSAAFLVRERQEVRYHLTIEDAERAAEDNMLDRWRSAARQ